MISQRPCLPYPHLHPWCHLALSSPQSPHSILAETLQDSEVMMPELSSGEREVCVSQWHGECVCEGEHRAFPGSVTTPHPRPRLHREGVQHYCSSCPSLGSNCCHTWELRRYHLQASAPASSLVPMGRGSALTPPGPAFTLPSDISKDAGTSP